MSFRLFRRVPACLRDLQSRYYTVPSPQHSIYVSKSTNPYFNLTFEDWLFRHKNPQEPLLLIYRDEPSVIIGRNQNPWKEVNFKALQSRPDILWVRRRSGGGTVYHDLGNTNFSIHLPRRSFDRHVTARIIVRAVRSLGIDARVNDRNDICVGAEKIRFFRSALNSFGLISLPKIVNTRAYHHGTMLISTKLDTLGDMLQVNKDTMVTKGVPSVRSPVCNLQQWKWDLSHESFTQAVINEFRKEYNLDVPVEYIEETQELKDVEYIKKGMEELPNWQWAYGQTPEFTYTIDRVFNWGHLTAEINSKHGSIHECKLSSHAKGAVPESSLKAIGESLAGKRYGFLHEERMTGRDAVERDILDWLTEATRM